MYDQTDETVKIFSIRRFADAKLLKIQIVAAERFVNCDDIVILQHYKKMNSTK